MKFGCIRPQWAQNSAPTEVLPKQYMHFGSILLIKNGNRTITNIIKIIETIKLWNNAVTMLKTAIPTKIENNCGELLQSDLHWIFSICPTIKNKIWVFLIMKENSLYKLSIMYKIHQKDHSKTQK